MYFRRIGRTLQGQWKQIHCESLSGRVGGGSEDDCRFFEKEYHDARHHCYAYRLGYRGDVFRANDDGEPSSSAGRPILGQIDSNCLSDILVVVIRYFGGIKLGIPGLIRAYKTSTADAISNAVIITKVAMKRYRLRFGYLAINSVMKMAKDMSLEQSGQDFGTDCSMTVKVRLSSEAYFLERVGNIDDCTAVEEGPATSET